MELVVKTILLVRSGSRAYGVEDSTSDYDTTGVCIEDLSKRLSIANAPFEQYHRTEDDGVVYSLEKFCKLATKGNPNIVEVLFSPVLEYTKEGNALLELRDAFWSKKAGAAFLGYMQAQKERLQGLRGQKDVNRKGLVEKYGYDTKYAYHIIRLGLIGREYLQSGYIQLPMSEMHRRNLRAIRAGEWKLGEVIAEAEELERQLKMVIEFGAAPREPDISKIEGFIADAYLSHWSEKSA